MRGRGVGQWIIVGMMLIGAAFIGTTWWALEWSGVAIVQTEAPDGEVRTTRVWHAEHEGEIWLEAGSAESPWYRDLEHSRAIVLTIEGESLGYWAEPLPNPAGHERIRKLLRSRYGLRDRWIELILDMSGTIAVRLIGPEGPVSKKLERGPV